MRARVLFLLLLALLLTSCLPGGPNAVILTEKEAGTNLSLYTGDGITVNLEGNPSTGYTWERTGEDNGVVRQVGEPGFQPAGSAPGSPGQVSLHFEAVKPGQATLTLIYHRTWEKDVPPARTFQVTVTVK